MLAVDLSKQQALDADPKANLDRDGNTRLYFILEETKETIFEFSQGTVKVLDIYLNTKYILSFISIK